MKVVILAGGLGTRLSEETDVRPKPMVEVGGMPIIWHIMKIYSQFGFNEFIICLGYKGYSIKEYFSNYFLHQSDISLDLESNSVKVLKRGSESWKVDLIDTGLHTQTGGRLAKIRDRLEPGQDFLMTYGDGVCDLDLHDLVAFHKSHGKKATLTAVLPPARFGRLEFGSSSSNKIVGFTEKPAGDGAYINGGFFCLNESCLDLVDGPDCIWEQGPLEKLVRNAELQGYRHDGFWRPMDTLRDKTTLNQMVADGVAPWIRW